MRYTFFEFENFKGISHIRIDLAKTPQSPIHTLVGLNESGKTTVLEAINYFSYGDDDLDVGELAGYQRPDINDLIPISKRDNFNGVITIRAGLELDPPDLSTLRSILKREFNFRLSSVDPILITAQYQFENSKHNEQPVTKIWKLVLVGRMPQDRKDRPFTSDSHPEWVRALEVLKELIPRIWYFPNFLFEFPDKIYLQDKPAPNILRGDRDKFFRLLLQDILDSLENKTDLKAHILDRATSGTPVDKRNLDQLLLGMARRVTQDVFGAWDQMFGRKVQAQNIKLDVHKDEKGLWYVEFTIEDSDGYFAINERSLGFRWFFVYLLITSYRGFRKAAPTKLVLLLDEPASNLHSSAQQQLLKSFERLAERCTIIYTTHSHHLINPNWLENTFVVRNDGLDYSGDTTDFVANKTNIAMFPYRQFVSQYPNQTSYFQPILDVLDYRPSNLESVPDVVMLEGKTDFYCLMYMQTVILNRKRRLHLLPGGGAGSLEQSIRLYLAWAKNFIVILDGDREGKKQKERYTAKFGPILTNRVLTLSDLFADIGGVGLEGLFAPEDKLKTQQSVCPESRAFEKNLFHRAIQEALACSRAIELSMETRGRFEQILDMIVNKLDGHAKDDSD